MTEAEIRKALRSFILSNFLAGEDVESLQDSTPLVTSGLIPSVSMLELVMFLEDTFSLTLEGDDLGVERMDSVDRLVELVQERVGGDADRVHG